MNLPKGKKEYIALGILLLAILAIIYFIFFRSSPSPETTVGISNSPVAAADNSASQAGAAAAPASAAARSSVFLPNGAALNLQLLEDPRFKNLLPPIYPTVDRSEIGQINPFLK